MRRRLKRDEGRVRVESLVTLLIVVGSLAAWELAAQRGSISNLFFPPPTKILSNLFDLTLHGRIMGDLRATMTRLVGGLVIGCVPACFIGLLMGWSPRVRNVLDPIVGAIHPIPKIAILPILMVLFGIGELSKVMAAAFSAFFPMLINSQAGVRAISPLFFEVARSYGAKPWDVLWRVVLPGSLPMILAGFRISLNVALLVTIAVEFVSARKGLGTLIWMSWETFRTEDLYAGVTVIAIIGILFAQILRFLNRRLVPWNVGPVH